MSNARLQEWVNTQNMSSSRKGVDKSYQQSLPSTILRNTTASDHTAAPRRKRARSPSTVEESNKRSRVQTTTFLRSARRFENDPLDWAAEEFHDYVPHQTGIQLPDEQKVDGPRALTVLNDLTMREFFQLDDSQIDQVTILLTNLRRRSRKYLRWCDSLSIEPQLEASDFYAMKIGTVPPDTVYQQQKHFILKKYRTQPLPVGDSELLYVPRGVIRVFRDADGLDFYLGAQVCPDEYRTASAAVERIRTQDLQCENEGDESMRPPAPNAEDFHFNHSITAPIPRSEAFQTAGEESLQIGIPETDIGTLAGLSWPRRFNETGPYTFHSPFQPTVPNNAPLLPLHAATNTSVMPDLDPFNPYGARGDGSVLCPDRGTYLPPPLDELDGGFNSPHLDISASYGSGVNSTIDGISQWPEFASTIRWAANTQENPYLRTTTEDVDDNYIGASYGGGDDNTADGILPQLAINPTFTPAANSQYYPCLTPTMEDIDDDAQSGVGVSYRCGDNAVADALSSQLAVDPDFGLGHDRWEYNAQQDHEEQEEEEQSEEDQGLEEIAKRWGGETSNK